MDKEMPNYKVTHSKGDLETGIDQVAFVKDPAILIKGVKMSSQVETSITQIEIPMTQTTNKSMEFKLMDEDKMIVTGPVLIPNQKIYRYDQEMGEYTLEFDQEAIYNLIWDFRRNVNKNQFNDSHNSKNIAPSFLLENWFIVDSENDKSNSLGFNLPVGTAMFTSQVTDREYWDKEIKKNGKYGFSIEGYLDMRLSEMVKQGKLNMKIEEKSTELNKSEVSNIYKKEKQNMKYSMKMKFSKMAILNDGTIVYTPNEFKEGEEVFVFDITTGEQVAQLDGDYTFEDGTTYTIVGGKITVISGTPAEEDTTVPVIETATEVTEEVKQEVAVEDKENLEATNKILEELSKISKELNETRETLKSIVEFKDETTKKIEDLSKPVSVLNSGDVNKVEKKVNFSSQIVENVTKFHKSK